MCIYICINDGICIASTSLRLKASCPDSQPRARTEPRSPASQTPLCIYAIEPARIGIQKHQAPSLQKFQDHTTACKTHTRSIPCIERASVLLWYVYIYIYIHTYTYTYTYTLTYTYTKI